MRSWIKLPCISTPRRLITPVTDRPGHDRRYAIDPARISSELGWRPRHDVQHGLAETGDWYPTHQFGAQKARAAGYDGRRLGATTANPRYENFNQSNLIILRLKKHQNLRETALFATITPNKPKIIKTILNGKIATETTFGLDGYQESQSTKPNRLLHLELIPIKTKQQR